MKARIGVTASGIETGGGPDWLDAHAHYKAVARVGLNGRNAGGRTPHRRLLDGAY